MTTTAPDGPPGLLAVAHGSRDFRHMSAAEDLIAMVRDRAPRLVVSQAFLDHGTPSVKEAVGRLAGPTVVVPLLLTAAFHTDVDLPAALARATLPVAQAPALGPHPRLLDALVRRLAEAGVDAGDGTWSVVLAAAGSSRDAAVEAVAEVAHDLGTRDDVAWPHVVAAYASAASPTPTEAVQSLRAAGARRIAMATYLMFPGVFADSLAGAGADVVSPPLGACLEVADVVLDRYAASVVDLS